MITTQKMLTGCLLSFCLFSNIFGMEAKDALPEAPGGMGADQTNERLKAVVSAVQNKAHERAVQQLATRIHELFGEKITKETKEAVTQFNKTSYDKFGPSHWGFNIVTLRRFVDDCQEKRLLMDEKSATSFDITKYTVNIKAPDKPLLLHKDWLAYGPLVTLFSYFTLMSIVHQCVDAIKKEGDKVQILGGKDVVLHELQRLFDLYVLAASISISHLQQLVKACNDGSIKDHADILNGILKKCGQELLSKISLETSDKLFSLFPLLLGEFYKECKPRLTQLQIAANTAGIVQLVKA